MSSTSSNSKLKPRALCSKRCRWPHWFAFQFVLADEHRGWGPTACMYFQSRQVARCAAKGACGCRHDPVTLTGSNDCGC